MDFLLWACRSLHIFSTVVWLGGLFYQGVVLGPVLLGEGKEFRDLDRILHGRFLPFIWSSIWSILMTGMIMMLLDPRFVWFEFESTWSKFLLGKQLSFALMVGLTVSSSRAWKKIFALDTHGNSAENSSNVDDSKKRFVRLSRRNIMLAILTLLLTAGLDLN